MKVDVALKKEIKLSHIFDYNKASDRVAISSALGGTSGGNSCKKAQQIPHERTE